MGSNKPVDKESQVSRLLSIVQKAKGRIQPAEFVSTTKLDSSVSQNQVYIFSRMFPG